MRQILFTIIVICLTHFANAQNYMLHQNIQYDMISGVDPNLLSLDVYKPTKFSGLRPVMIIIHGGYWNAGDKTNFQGNMANLFADSGYVSVSINYRLSPDPVDTLSSTGMRFPIHPHDCARAVAWVFNNIGSYSGDTSKVSLIGHSAGAHLALLLSTNETFLLNEGISLNKIKCTCSLDAGVFDLIEELQQAGNNITRRAPLLNAFGLDASLYDDASPQYHIEAGKDLPWMHLVHQNTSDRIYGNIRFKDSLVTNGYPNVSLFNANPYNHGQIALALGNPLDSIGETQSVMVFYSNCLANNITLTSVNNNSIIPYNFILQHNYPNPFNPSTVISYQISAFSHVSLKVFDVLGREVATLVNEFKQSGSYNFQFSIMNYELPSGVYFYQFKAGNYIETKKMMVVK